MTELADIDRWVDQLADALPAWLPTQRWFAGKDRPITGIARMSAKILLRGEATLLHVVVQVVQDDRQEAYQLLVGHREHPPEIASASWILADAGLYEACGDADLTSVLLEKMAAGEEVGGLRFGHEPGVELEAGLRARPITSEQSNTSLVYGSRYILKLFRKLSTGENKDLVLHRALRDVGSKHIAQPLGSITGELAGEPVTVGMLQQFLPDAVDGWAMATTSVRDLMAAPSIPEDFGAQQPRPDEVGGDFAGEAERLGASVAEVHGDLARALGTEPVDAAELDRTVKAMLDRLDTVAAQVPDLSPHVPALRSAFEQVRGLREATEQITMQSIHGDLHLGQVLRTVGGWLLIDFEGEPAATVEDRRALRSPLRDVAGMLRSFDYAAHSLLVGQEADDTRVERAMEWTTRNRDAFCEGYAAASVEGAGDPREHSTLLRAFELDKAVYEVSYEHANRPDWLVVPLASIARITDGGDRT